MTSCPKLIATHCMKHEWLYAHMCLRAVGSVLDGPSWICSLQLCQVNTSAKRRTKPTTLSMDGLRLRDKDEGTNKALGAESDTYVQCSDGVMTYIRSEIDGSFEVNFSPHRCYAILSLNSPLCQRLLYFFSILGASGLLSLLLCINSFTLSCGSPAGTAKPFY
jgi:hypothetical protein